MSIWQDKLIVHHTHVVTNNDEHDILLRFSDMCLFLLELHVGMPFGGLMFCLRLVGGNPRSILRNNIWWKRYACFDHSNSSAAVTFLNSIYSANKTHGTYFTNTYATLKNLHSAQYWSVLDQFHSLSVPLLTLIWHRDCINSGYIFSVPWWC